MAIRLMPSYGDAWKRRAQAKNALEDLGRSLTGTAASMVRQDLMHMRYAIGGPASPAWELSRQQHTGPTQLRTTRRDMHQGLLRRRAWSRRELQAPYADCEPCMTAFTWSQLQGSDIVI